MMNTDSVTKCKKNKNIIVIFGNQWADNKLVGGVVLFNWRILAYNCTIQKYIYSHFGICIALSRKIVS